MTVSRRLVAVFAADVEGYSRLMGTDEVGTLKGLTERRAILDRHIGDHRGRIANTAGDSVLAEFGSAVDAVQCAVEAQTALAEANSSLAPDRRISFRIGIHIGDVMVRAGDLFGDGVNIAARLQTLAKAGGLCVSSVTYDQVRKILPLSFTDLGAQTVKNIEEPIRAYEVRRQGKEAVVGSNDVPAQRLSIVVLPFANIGGDPEQDYFVDGVTESLTTDLSRIGGSFVIGRNTAFTYKGKHVDLKRVGRELNVRYILEGSVQRGGNRLRVNVQLIDAETGNHLWAERFDKPFADLFDMQDEIVSRLANTLNTQLIEAEARRAERSLHPDATDLIFQGRAWLNKGITPEYMEQARGFFDHALALDPSNIEAMVGLAQANIATGASFFADDRTVYLDAAEMGLITVLNMAPQHARAHVLLGTVQCLTNRAVQGIAECEHGLALDRNLAEAHAAIGLAKNYIGRGEQTEAHISEALRLSPRDTFAFRWLFFGAVAKLHLGADTDAVAWLRRSIEANRSYPLAHFFLAAALALLGELDQARAAAQAGRALDPSFTIRRYRVNTPSDNPTFLAARERIYEGMRIAGVPEG
jgi:TolB-like protein/class 3 adenylate cyclase